MRPLELLGNKYFFLGGEVPLAGQIWDNHHMAAEVWSARRPQQLDLLGKIVG